MSSEVRAGLARLLLPRYSQQLELANYYASAREWARRHRGAPILGSRTELHRHAARAIGDAGRVDFLEFGVGRDTTLRLWTSLCTEPSSRFFGFDSFQGLPEAWSPKFPRGSFGTEGRTPTIPDGRVRFIEGLFQESLPSFLRGYQPSGSLVVHMDADLYTSTLYCLAQVDSLLRRNSVLIFDEFGTAQEFGAFRDYTRSFRRSFRLLGATRSTDRSVFDQVALALD
jgi:O-methyltransferase